MNIGGAPLAQIRREISNSEQAVLSEVAKALRSI
jgi:hypothetical protein